MVAWVQYHKCENNNLPDTTEEWESNFNKDIFNNFEDDSVTKKTEVKGEDTESRNKGDKNTTIINIRMSDYLYFDLTVSGWPGVKEKHEALLKSQGLNELVNIKDEDAHELKIDVK